jgi:predicted enzyme related to lactoylglutathione lyase
MTPTPGTDNPAATSKAFAYDEPMIGHCAWNELATTAQDAAVFFYTKQFRWQQKDVMDMGPMGKYKFLHHGEKMLGAVMINAIDPQGAHFSLVGKRVSK